MLPTAVPPLPSPSGIAASPVATAPNTLNQLTITRKDDGATVLAAAGDLIVVQLGDDFRWSLGQPDPSVLAPIPDLRPGVQGSFRALRPARLDLTATGTANCAPGVPCPLFAILFKVDLVIR